MEIARQLGGQQGIAGTLNNIAAIHDEKGEYDEAMPSYLGLPSSSYRFYTTRMPGLALGLARIIG